MPYSPDLARALPDYAGRSIVNLMQSIGARFGRAGDGYAPHSALPAERLRQARRVVLVVIDGLGDALLNHFEDAAAAAGGNTGPRLAAARAGTMTSVFPPTTATAVTTLMSGCAPQQHALTGWHMHFRELGVVTAVLPFQTRVRPLPLVRAGVPIGTVVDAPSFCAALDAPATMLQPDDLVDSAYSQQLGAGATRSGYGDIDGFSRTVADYCRGDAGDGFFYAYWPRLDTLAHIRGPSHGEVREHFEMLNRALAPLLEVAEQHGTLLVITADHGFIDSGPSERVLLDDHPDLKAMLSLPLCGEPRTAYAYVRARAADAFERYVATALDGICECHASEDLIDAGWFGHGEVHPELRARLGDYVLLTLGDHAIYDRLAGERSHDLRGVHGGHSAAEQYVPLIVAGP